ncbi:hypothetical protein [Paraburkholderia ferrariae]|uniref:Uncharacterized protein n=1 Tax=Paraburkholderia ferrariae TaxID=386056 RepID=A0ABU9S1A2_9BURK
MGTASTTLNVVSTAGAAALAVAGAPVWLTVAAGLGLLVAGGAILAGKGTLQLSSDGKTVSMQQPAPTSVNQSYPGASGSGSTYWDQAVTMGVGVYHTPSCASNDAFCSRFPAAPTSGQKNFDYVASLINVEAIASTVDQVSGFEQARLQASATPCPGFNCSQFNYGYVYYQWNADGTSATLWETYSFSYPVTDSSGNTTMQPQVTTQKLAGWTVSPSMFPVSASDLGTLYSKLNSSTTTAPLDANTLANLTNLTWQRASAQQGYQGLPYTPTQPITSLDVQPWIDANPSSAPTVGDLFSPAADPATNTVTISPTVSPGSSSSSDTGASTGTNPNVNVVNTPNVNVTNKVSVDLGTDPGIGSPGLESTPTIQMILQPLLNLLPDLKSWTVPAHSAQCPEPEVNLFGKSFKMTAHCDLAEQTRTVITSLSLAAFALAALFIVLTA